MNSHSTECPTDTIDAFLAGELSDTQLTMFQQHLDGCDHCDAELTRRTADEAFWHDTRKFLCSAADDLSDPYATPTSNADAAEFDVQQQWRRLAFLDPTDDPRMMGRFGGYEISGVIGSGGMGVVMKGWDVSLDRFVAIKVLNPAYTGQSASRKRFAREAQAAAAVLHDNVIAIYGVDHWNDMPYLVMPYIKGESLQQRIDRTAPLCLEDMLGISLQIARGLAAAHDQGLVHRDIKPANILMPASVSRVIITDFGLARTADDASLTHSGVLAGTPQYMSPEQAKGDAIDGRTDLFSLGSVMYAMACGRPPFRADTPYGVLRKITDEPHRPLSRVRDDTPAWFEAIVDRLLQKEPSKRFDSAHELAAHLEDCLAHLRQPTTTLLPKLDAQPKRSRPTAWLAAVLTILVVVAVSVAVVLTSSNPSADATTGSAIKSSPAAAVTTDAESVGANQERLRWEFDESRLDRLENELDALLQETAIPPLPDPQSTTE